MCQRVNDTFIWSTEAGDRIAELERERDSLIFKARHIAWKLDTINDMLLDYMGAGLQDLKTKLSEVERAIPED